MAAYSSARYCGSTARKARIVKSKNGSRSASIFLTAAQSRLIPSIPNNNAVPAKSNFVLT